MNELRHIVALCRRDPEVGAICLQFAACFYGILSLLLGSVPVDVDLAAIGALTEYPFATFDEHSSMAGHLLLRLGFAYFATFAIAMGVAGVGLEIAYRLGLVQGARR